MRGYEKANGIFNCSSSKSYSYWLWRKDIKVNKDSGKIDLSLWYWNRALDDDLLEQVNEKFPSKFNAGKDRWRF